MSGFDGYDDDVPLVAVGAHSRVDVEDMLRMAIQLAHEAKALPMSSSVKINREDLLEILEACLASIPQEIKEARWALRDREELMNAERVKAEQLMNQVKAEAARLIDNMEIIRQAKIRAQEIVLSAEEAGRVRVNETEDFIDRKLGEVEIVLDRLTKTVRTGRERLRPTVVVHEAEAEGSFFESHDPLAVEEDDEGTFFDQDAH